MNFSTQFLNLLFPPTCLGCHQPGSYLCRQCLTQTIDFHPTQKCAICNKPSINGVTHHRCLTPHAINGTFAITRKNRLMTKLIKQLKYRHSYHIISGLTPISDYIPDFVHGFDYLVPVPLHPSRLRDRGFNQAQLLAQLFATKLNTPINSNLLIRTKLTTPQADIKDRQARLTNLKQVFSLAPNLDKQLIAGKKILLIDDVSTTGATLVQAAQVLKRAHAKTVWGLVLSR